MSNRRKRIGRDGMCLVILSIMICVGSSSSPARAQGIQPDVGASRLRETLPFRGVLLNHGDPRPPKSGDKAAKQQAQQAKLRRVETQLRPLSEQGYNAIVWTGHNEFWVGAPHAIVRHDEFPEARELTPEDNALAIEYMKAVFARAKDLGFSNYLYTISVLYTPAFARAHGYDKKLPVSMTVNISQNLGWPVKGGMTNCGVRNELTRAYTEALFAETSKIYQDLDGFYAVMGEPLPGRRSTWFNEAVVPGLNRSGRRPVLIVQQWEIPLEDFMRDIVSPPSYENLWLNFHGYNSEQITDAKPFPSLVRWAETTGLPTVAAFYPMNLKHFPFNSPRFAYEITQEMKKTVNFIGFMYWRFHPPLSSMFQHALAYYAKADEPYSDEPWLAQLEQQYGDRKAAEHFLRAFDVSARIIPEMSALIYKANGDSIGPRELRLPYHSMDPDWNPFIWTTARMRGQPLIPVHQYARMVAKNPGRYKDNNGSDPQKNGYRQITVWKTEGGGDYDALPPAHMEKIREMGEACLEQAEAGLATVKKNAEEARHVRDFMKSYQLMSRYYEKKVAAATAAMIYAHTREPAHKTEAEKLADQTLESYLEATTFMHENLEQAMARIYHKPYRQGKKDLRGLIEEEEQDRADIGRIFNWP